MSDDLARDIRAAEPNTVLSKAYAIGEDTVIVKIIQKKEASRDTFDSELEELRNHAIAEKADKLIGSPEVFISGGMEANMPNGLWVQHKIDEAKQEGILTLNEEYFAAIARKRQKRAEEQQDM